MPSRSSFAADRLQIVVCRGICRAACRRRRLRDRRRWIWWRPGKQDRPQARTAHCNLISSTWCWRSPQCQSHRHTLPRVFICDRRIKAPDGISDTVDVSGLALLTRKISDNCYACKKFSRQIVFERISCGRTLKLERKLQDGNYYVHNTRS